MAKPWKTKNLDPTASLSFNIAKVIKTKHQEMLFYSKGSTHGDVDAIHDMRVASRRLITLLDVAGDLFPKVEYRVQYDRIKTIVRALGKVRDHDVFIKMLEEDARSLTAADKVAVIILIKSQTRRRAKRYKQLLKELKRFEKKKSTKSFYKFLKDAVHP